MTEHAFAACGPNCVAHPIITDTADGREHENCLDDDTLAAERFDEARGLLQYDAEVG